MVNRGDSFRRRRSRSNSLAPTSGVQYDSTSGDVISKSRPVPNNGTSTGDNLAAAAASDQRQQHQHQHHHHDVRTYRVAIIAAHGVGKSALVGQFMSSDCINAYDRVRNGKLFPTDIKQKLEQQLKQHYHKGKQIKVNWLIIY